MNLLKVLSVLVSLMALILTIAALPIQEQEDFDYALTNQYNEDEASDFGRFPCQKKSKARRLSCNKSPRVCHPKGSPGAYYCKKKCVNILIDRHNCGACGKRCKYNMICCNGNCVNPFFDTRHCGGCNNRCNNGEFCSFGLCNYA